MEPKLPTPNAAPDMGKYRHPELPINPESQPQKNPETPAAQAQEAAPQSGGGSMPMPQVQHITLPTPQAGQAPSLPPNDQSKSDSPLVADDQEVIEKEWVDKAKKIVNQTRDDPYSQEKEVSKLQADYLKKRYGKDVKLASD